MNHPSPAVLSKEKDAAEGASPFVSILTGRTRFELAEFQCLAGRVRAICREAGLKKLSPTLVGSTISACSIASPREQRVLASLTADKAGHPPTDDEADDCIPDDVALRAICVAHEGKS
jgi:hypothetical protein